MPTASSSRSVAGHRASGRIFLLVKKERQPPPVGFFHRLLVGREDPYDYIPINRMRPEGDSVIVQKFVDEGRGRAKGH